MIDISPFVLFFILIREVTMAKLDNIIFCLNASNVEGQGASAHNILHALNPEYVPGLFTFSVIISILDMDPSENHVIEIVFSDPNGNVIVNINSALPIIENVESNLPSEYTGFDLSMNWANVNFVCSGVYTLRIKMDAEDLGEKSIFVKGKNQ